MEMRISVLLASLFFQSAGVLATEVTDTDGAKVTIQAGHESLKKWVLPAMSYPENNKPTAERIALGKMLFADPRMSGTNQVTCLSCHLPERGWTDGFKTAERFMGKTMERATPTIVNLGYNTIFMWDGRMPSLEKQAFGGQGIKADISAGMSDMGLQEGIHIERLKKVQGYVKAFEDAYPGEGITRETIAKAIANFERSVTSDNSPFDKWLKGDATAMTESQIRGFALFVNPEKGNCSVCHSAPNFTDNGFHNIGLKSFASEKPDVGRFKEKPLPKMKGAFKTPTLRDVSLTAPYFHDGSALTLKEVVDHYARGGDAKSNLSPNMKVLSLTDKEKADLLEFLAALTTDHGVFVYPVLPQ